MNLTSSIEKNKYKGIVKATSLFGGVQVWRIIIEVIRQKVLAVIIGAEGIGIMGLYQSLSSLIQGLTSFGLSTSAVKNVSEAKELNNIQKITEVYSVLKKLVFLTGILGLLVMSLLSPWLSNITFGNYEKTIPIIILSCSLFFLQLSAGEMVLLQGMRCLKDLAKANIWGALIGLLLSLPCYIFFGIDGIVPAFIINSIVLWIVTLRYSKRIHFKTIRISIIESYRQGKNMIQMGLAMSLNSIMVLCVAYLVKIFISKQSGVECVGLYTAGVAIVNGYVGMIFSAMSTDFYPRLAAVNHENERCKEIVNYQLEVAFIILIPVIVLFIIFAPLAVKILYSEEFNGIISFIRISMIGMFLKTASWGVSFILIAKQDMKSFLINEIIGNSIVLVLNICFFYFWGLLGIALASILSYLFYVILVTFVANVKYSFNYSKDALIMCFVGLLLSVFGLFIVGLSNGIINILACVLIILFSCCYSLYELEEKTGIIKSIIRK